MFSEIENNVLYKMILFLGLTVSQGWNIIVPKQLQGTMLNLELYLLYKICLIGEITLFKS